VWRRPDVKKNNLELTKRPGSRESSWDTCNEMIAALDCVSQVAGHVVTEERAIVPTTALGWSKRFRKSIL
jgi:hypothetical protein